MTFQYLQSPSVASLVAICLLTASAFVVRAEQSNADAKHPSSVTAGISKEAELSAAAIRIDKQYQVTPVASEPLFANPVAFCFDPAGRIFVVETHRVHQGTEDNRNHMDWLDDDLAAKTVADRRAYIERRMPDRLNHFTDSSEIVRLLEDRDRDGVYDHSNIFSDGYNQIESGAAAGALWMGDRLWLTSIPSLWELKDADGDGYAEQKKELATGFGVHFALFGHDLHGLIEGPDGKIYFSIGDRGLHVETPNGLLSNPDSGSVLRCNRDGSELEIVATGLRNPQELAFNEYGDLFSVDNNSDSGDRARIIQIVEGMKTGWRMSYQYLPDRGPFNREKIWRTQNDEQPAGIVPPIAHLSDGPSGLVYYPGTGLADIAQGTFFLADFRGAAGSSGIRSFRLEPQGAGYRLADDAMFLEGVLATDCDFGPDGDFYVADWIDGWDGTGMGRIYRVSSDDPASVEARKKSTAALQQIPAASADELIALLNNPNMRVRLAAQHRLVAMDATTSQPLAGLAINAKANQLARIHALWALGELAVNEPDFFSPIAKLCQDTDAEIRTQAARTLGRGRKLSESRRHELGSALLPLLADDSPRAQAAAATSLGSLRYAPALAGLLVLAKSNDNADPIVRHAAAMGLAGSQTPEQLVTAAQNGAAKEGADATPPERLAIVLALAIQRSPLVANFLTDDSETIVLEAARTIWDEPIPNALFVLAEMITRVPPTNDPLARRVLAANQAMRSPGHLQAVVRFALNPNAPAPIREHAWSLASQWAAPSSRDPVHGQWRPLTERPAAEIVAALAELWPDILRRGADDPTGIIVAAELGLPDALKALPQLVEQPNVDAILQARAIAALENADDAVAQRVIAAGLRSSDGSVRSAARQLLAERFPQQAIAPLREVADDDAADMRERQAAMTMLGKIALPAAQESIAAWLTRAEQGDCPPELLLEVLEAAQAANEPSLTARRQALLDKLAASDDPAAIHAPALIGGDAARGEQLFLTNESLSCRRCHSLKPREQLVGPSLAAVGAERSRAELIESITHPNAKIVDGFQTTAMMLDTGVVITGIVRSEDAAHAVLLDADGKEVEVDLDTVEDRVQGLSAMPEDLMKYMTPRDLRDLVEFLSQQRKTGPGKAKKAAAGHGT